MQFPLFFARRFSIARKENLENSKTRKMKRASQSHSKFFSIFFLLGAPAMAAASASPIPTGDDSEQHKGLISALLSWWKSKKQGEPTTETDYGSLVDVVSFSSRRIAARRAIESEQHPPLFSDPLASKLAGSALKDARRSSMRSNGTKLDRRVSRVAVRTKWFDEEVEGALRGVRGTVEVEAGAIPSASGPSSVGVSIRERRLPRPWPSQVVCLGCGMDTRPWRLDFNCSSSTSPSRVSKDSEGESASSTRNLTRWFDVDVASVLKAKARELEEAGAEIPEGAFDLAFEEEQRKETEEEERRRRQRRRGRKVKFPLKVSSYTAVPADVSKPGALTGALSLAGHDPTKPTIFVAEGLLMYLGRGGVEVLLSEAAQSCPCSSSPSCSSTSSPSSSSSSTFLAVTISTSALRSAQERSRRRKSKGIDVAATDLLASWNFGCDARDLPKLLGGNGWSSEVDSVVTRSDMARRYRGLVGDRGFEYEVADEKRSEERGSLFFVARK